MAIPVLILGQSGTGKSYSMKNFDEKEVCLISVQKSLLPFRKKFTETTVTDKYTDIIKAMKATKKKVIVIDDCQYLMANEFMRRATERGYDKFTEIAFNFWNLIVEEVNKLPEDTIVYLLCHTATDDNGVEKMKTIGKLMDEKITPEGLFMIVLKTAVSDGNYAFVTQNNGHDTVKSPEGMFTAYAINNDLKYVDDKIRNYYELTGGKSDAEIAEADKEAVSDIEPPKSRRERKRDEEPVKRERRHAKDITDAVEETKEEMADAIESAQNGAVVPMATDEHKPLRQRKSREQVQAENEAAIVNANLSDEAEELPFEEAEEPEVEELPRRRRRRA